MSRQPVAVVTGGTDGIGRAVAARIAAQGWHVVVVGRNRGRVSAGYEFAEFLPADLSLLAETHTLADRILERHPRVDALICCAGNFALRPEWTDEGLERAFVLNYLSRFLLVARLVPAIEAAPSGRVVLVGNAGRYRDCLDLDDLDYRHGRPGMRVATRSQFAGDLMTVELASRHPRLEVTGVFPGLLATDLFRHATGVPRALAVTLTAVWHRVGRDPAVAADTPAWLATAPEAVGVSGSFFGPDRRPRTVPARVLRADRRRDLWSASVDVVRATVPAWCPEALAG